ncbi:MAG TPA: VWA domain-containing protein [Actinomycetota bacterium]|nr:VWA domain-containing protein [Actinomycetota bacterium]
MSVLWPGFLWALVLVPLAMVAYLLAQRRRAAYAVRFTNLDLLANVVTRSPGWRRHLPALLYLLALSTLLVSLARPQSVVLVPKEQATVMLVIDVSGSMNATDVEPTRLLAAQQAANSFVNNLPAKFRVGLVSFSATAQTLTRPTTDREAVRDALSSLHAEGGTAMGDAIERGLEAKRPPAPQVDKPPKGSKPGGQRPTPTTSAPPAEAQPAGKEPPVVMLLLSDGANTVGRKQPLEAAEDARRLHVPIFTIALGTDSGVVEVPDESGQPRRIPVPPDKVTLRRVADTTGGKFFTAPSSRDLKGVYRDLGSRIGFVKERQEVTVVFAAAALLLLVAGGALSLAWFNRFP